MKKVLIVVALVSVTVLFGCLSQVPEEQVHYKTLSELYAEQAENEAKYQQYKLEHPFQVVELHGFDGTVKVETTISEVRELSLTIQNLSDKVVSVDPNSFTYVGSGDLYMLSPIDTYKTMKSVPENYTQNPLILPPMAEKRYFRLYPRMLSDEYKNGGEVSVTIAYEIDGKKAYVTAK
jgi:outer membrane murein-binding lipoprotein Lpp